MRSQLIALLFLVVTTSVSLGQDSLVHISELHFDSPYEKQVLLSYLKEGSNDMFSVLMANGSLLSEEKINNARTRFYGLLNDLNNEKFAVKKPDKKAKAVIELVQSKYLKKYVAGSRFEEIFQSGNFSELSGTALYSLGFDYLNIPYSIKENLENVYVVACPDKEKIMVESTVSSIGFYQFDETFKQNFVQVLKKQKIISEQEFNRSNTDALFDAYYFSKGTVLLQSLAGLQYANDGVMMSQNQNEEPAFYQLEKAYLLDPSPRILFMLMQAGNQAFVSHHTKDLIHASLLGKVSRYKAIDVTDEMIAGEFASVIQSLLFDKNQKEKLDAYFNELLANISNLQTENEIKFVYYYENGRYLYNQARYKDAMIDLGKALNEKPTNQEAAMLFINSLSQVAVNRIQTQDFVTLIQGYNTSFQSLENNNLFNTLLASTYLVHFGTNYETSKPAEGDKYKQLFEALNSKHTDLNLNSVLVGKAYSAAAVYYYRKGQTKKAKEFIDAGLKLSPQNYELLSRQEMIR